MRDARWQACHPGQMCADLEPTLLITVRHSSVSAPSSLSGASYFRVTSHAGSLGKSTTIKRWRMIMKTIVSALVALSVLTGVAGSVQAADFGSQDFWAERARNQN
jgi:hypothetical protein